MLTYPNIFLNEMLGGISDNDFVLFASKSGIGKTTLANSFAESFKTQGAKPAFLSLENTAGDTVLLRAYFAWKQANRQWDSRFRVWKDTLIKQQPSEYLDFINAAQKSLDGILLIENQGTFSERNLDIALQQVLRNKCDVVVLDHLDFISISERDIAAAMSGIVQKLKQFIDTNKIPVIAFSHLAKKIEPKVIIPRADDFFGTSNKYKYCTAAVMIAAAHDYADPTRPHLYPTYFCIRKDRYGNSKDKGCVVSFNTHIGDYDFSQIWKIKVSEDGTKVKELDGKGI